MTDDRIYSPSFVHDLFQGMAATYGTTNLVSSFGFCALWRRQCVSLAGLREGMVVLDLMSGMGECWPSIARRIGSTGRIVGVDFSAAMCARADRVRRRLRGPSVDLLEEDVLDNSVGDGVADCVVSTFGLKTFSEAQRGALVAEIARILRPGGSFSLLEISVPERLLLRRPYLFYLKRCIPTIGSALLGDPANYRLLGVYTEAFGDCSSMIPIFPKHGLEVEFRRLFFGCATLVCGRRAT